MTRACGDCQQGDIGSKDEANYRSRAGQAQTNSHNNQYKCIYTLWNIFQSDKQTRCRWLLTNSPPYPALPLLFPPCIVVCHLSRFVSIRNMNCSFSNWTTLLLHWCGPHTWRSQPVSYLMWYGNAGHGTGRPRFTALAWASGGCADGGEGSHPPKIDDAREIVHRNDVAQKAPSVAQCRAFPSNWTNAGVVSIIKPPPACRLLSLVPMTWAMITWPGDWINLARINTIAFACFCNRLWRPWPGRAE